MFTLLFLAPILNLCMLLHVCVAFNVCSSPMMGPVIYLATFQRVERDNLSVNRCLDVEISSLGFNSTIYTIIRLRYFFYEFSTIGEIEAAHILMAVHPTHSI